MGLGREIANKKQNPYIFGALSESEGIGKTKRVNQISLQFLCIFFPFLFYLFLFFSHCITVGVLKKGEALPL